MTPKDKIGHRFGVGDTIAYGHALGRCAGLRIGRVLAVKYKDKVNPWDGHGWRITVIGIDDDWDHRSPRLTSRAGTLQFPSRCLVIPRDRVPADYLALLDSYESKTSPS